MRIYLASPLGFSPEYHSYRQRIRIHLLAQGHEILDPWERDYERLFQEALGIKSYTNRLEQFQKIAKLIGCDNRLDIIRSDAVLGVLDGPEPDSGTVGEVCFAAGKGKVAYGLRTDIRMMGDFPGVPLNLQVLDFIECSGGRLFTSVEEIHIP